MQSIKCKVETPVDSTIHAGCQEATPATGTPARWHELADRVLDGHRLSSQEGLAVLQSADAELLDVLSAAYRVRHRWFGNRVHLNFLNNAKSGLCSEDCGYCSQSRVSKADVPRYDMLSPEEILDGARLAAEREAGTYCIVISGRAPQDREIDRICSLVTEMKSNWGLKICASVGLLTAEQASRLKEAGVDRVNHNLNTSERFYPAICSTHSYHERLRTLRVVRQAGLEICSGGIVGMGEEDEDVVELALRLGELEAEAVPVNFLLPIPGTPLGDCPDFPAEDCPDFPAGDCPDFPAGDCPDFRAAKMGLSPSGPRRLNPRYCLKVLAMFRLANPKCELRIAAGREVHLGSLQPLGLFAASSIFVGDYLTTPGQPPEEDYRMIEELGFEVVPKRR